MEHDIFYKNHRHTKERHQADKVLAKKAMKQFRSKDASFGEKIAALATAGIMKAKVKLGMGLKINNKQYVRMLQKTKTTIENSLKSIEDCMKLFIQNELPKRQHSRKKRINNKKEKIKKIKKPQVMSQKENNNGRNDIAMDVDVNDDYPRNKIKRKNVETDVESSTAKRIKLTDDILSDSKPIIKARRKLTYNKNNNTESNNSDILKFDEPIVIPKKRKLDNINNDEIPHKVQVINSLQ